MIYRLFVPKQAVGANLVYFDLFNAAGSCADLEIVSLVPIVSGAAAVTGVLGVDLFLTRTSAIGTGGTAATVEGVSPTACTISAHDCGQRVPEGITARLTPSGGATAGSVISQREVFTEETNAASYNAILDFVRGLYPDLPGLIVPKDTGIRIVQGAIASVGNIGFDVTFRVNQRG